MIDEITPASVASEVHLLREDCSYEGVFLFVEGETDYALFSNYIDEGNCIIKQLGGRDKVLEIIKIMARDGDRLCLAIVDADFWYIEKKQPPNDNVFLTDTHDIETQIFLSPALEKVCRELFPSSEVKSLSENLPSIRQRIINVAANMALIRLVNHKYNLRICFYADNENSEVINWEPAVNIQKFTVDFNRLLCIVCRGDYSQMNSIRPYANQCNQECLDKKYNLYQLCNGHDVIFVTVLFLRCNGKRKECGSLSTKGLEKMLRLAYDADYFRETNLYKNLLTWQNTLGMKILKKSLG
jgi:hypothetical protein